MTGSKDSVGWEYDYDPFGRRVLKDIDEGRRKRDILNYFVPCSFARTILPASRFRRSVFVFRLCSGLRQITP